MARTPREGRIIGAPRLVRLALGLVVTALLGFAVAPGALAVTALLGFASAPAAPATSAHVAAAAPSIHALPMDSAAQQSALAAAFATGRHLPLAAVGAARAGSVRAAEDPASGRSWAVADFVPSPAATDRDALSFQDGASKALFAEAPGDTGWQWQGAAMRATCAASGSIPGDALRLLGLTTSEAFCDADAARPSAAPERLDSVGSSIASVALGQVGTATTPAETGFGGVDCNPYSTLVGAESPNSDGCGTDAAHSVADENEEWCADFAKWAWEQAGVTDDLNVLNAGANSFYAWAVATGESPAADSGTPRAGDAVVFYPSGAIGSGSYADHVGLITSVNPDGTVDMVNGDFLGANGITVEYGTGLNLTGWAASTWNPGEQWVLVVPPSAAGSAAPTVSVSAPTTAAAGTAVTLTASDGENDGPISRYAWTFGDGRDNDATGASARHVFPRAGLYTVTMTATSNLGTVTTKTWNVARERTVRRGFLRTELVGLVHHRSADAATSSPRRRRARSPWTVGTARTGSSRSSPAPSPRAAGPPASRTPTRRPPTPRSRTPTTARAVASSARPTRARAAGPARPWPVPPPRPALWPRSPRTRPRRRHPVRVLLRSVIRPRGLHAAGLGLVGLRDPGPGHVRADARSPWPPPVPPQYAFYLDGAGDVISATNGGGSWQSTPIPNSLGVMAGTSLSAATTDSGVDVFFVDAAGKLAVASLPSSGEWQTQELAGDPGRRLCAVRDQHADLGRATSSTRCST